MSSANIRMTDYPLIGIGVVRVTWPVFFKFYPNYIFKIGKDGHFKFRMLIDSQEY